jgi:hypothetical protein
LSFAWPFFVTFPASSGYTAKTAISAHRASPISSPCIRKSRQMLFTRRNARSYVSRKCIGRLFIREHAFCSAL